jgi:hypothetical protein
MNYPSYAFGLTAAVLLLAASPASAQDRGGGAGGADSSGATEATSGREGEDRTAEKSDTATASEQPVKQAPGERPHVTRQGRHPQDSHSGKPASEPAAPVEALPTTTGGGQ